MIASADFDSPFILDSSDPKSTGPVFDWVQARTRDIFSSATGGLQTVLSAISSYTVATELNPRTAGHTIGNLVSINPYYSPETRTDLKTFSNCGVSAMKEFSGTFFHEARHAYQYLLLTIAGNNDDGDYLPKTIGVAPTNILIDNGTTRTVCDQDAQTVEPRFYKGDSLFDSYQNPDWASRAIEMDAWAFSAIHAQ